MRTPRASLGPVNICSAGKKHRRQRRITASADGTRAAHSPPRGDLGLFAVGQLRNRLDNLFGKSARTFCRYFHRGPSRTCPSFVPRFVPSLPRSLVADVRVWQTRTSGDVRLESEKRSKTDMSRHRRITESGPGAD